MCWRRKRCASSGRARCAFRSRGNWRRGVTAKDMILHLIAALGAAAGTGYAIEYRRFRRPRDGCRGAADAVQPVDRTGREVRHGRARRNDLRLSGWSSLCAAGRDAGAGDRPLAQRCRAMRTRCSTAKSASTWPISRRRSPGARAPNMPFRSAARCPNPADAASAEQGEAWRAALDYMGLEAGQRTRRHAGRLGFHRVLRQFASFGPAGGGGCRARAARRRPCHRLDRAGIRASEARGRGRRAGRRCSAMRASNGANPVARCAWRPMASGCRPARARCRPRTAISLGDRGRARARIWPVLPWPPPPPSPA